MSHLFSSKLSYTRYWSLTIPSFAIAYLTASTGVSALPIQTFSLALTTYVLTSLPSGVCMYPGGRLGMCRTYIFYPLLGILFCIAYAEHMNLSLDQKRKPGLYQA